MRVCVLYVCVRVCVCACVRVCVLYSVCALYTHTHMHTYIYQPLSQHLFGFYVGVCVRVTHVLCACLSWAVWGSWVCFLLRLGGRVRVFLNVCPASSGVCVLVCLVVVNLFFNLFLPVF